MVDELFAFEKLDIYHLALDFSHKVHKIGQRVRNQNNRNWCDQIERAAISIVLNIAEGSGRKFPKEKRSFYNISRGSDFECVPLIELGMRSSYITEEEKNDLRSSTISIAKMLTKLIQSVEKDL
ncbi:MAG: four helix bundle protein [Deltaproteobacteria bacterium]|nr:four helix bundle protein [Deltaproteobacteria bacterium]